MIKIITQELEIESNLKQQLEFICELCHIKPTIINGSIRKIDKTNLSYIEPHKVIVKDTTFLAFNYSTDIYVGSLNKKIQLVELEDYIKNLLKALSLRVKTLERNNKEKDIEIISLKNKIFDLSETIEFWKNKFEKLINFLHSKIHNWFDKDDKYINVINDMYKDNILDDDINDLDLNKEKDDFEI